MISAEIVSPELLELMLLVSMVADAALTVGAAVVAHACQALGRLVAISEGKYFEVFSRSDRAMVVDVGILASFVFAATSCSAVELAVDSLEVLLLLLLFEVMLVVV